MNTGVAVKSVSSADLSAANSGQDSGQDSGQNSGQNSGNNPNGKESRTQAGCLCFGVFQLDLQQQRLFKDGLQAKVQGKVYQALVTLVETPGEIVTREALRARLWPRDTHLNYDANVNTTVNKLRQVLGDTNGESKFIETIPRKGYSFVAKVNYVEGPAVTSNAKTSLPAGAKKPLWSFVSMPQFLNSDRARMWFTASVVAWVVAAILFGAAVTLFSHRPIQPETAPRPAAQATQPVSNP